MSRATAILGDYGWHRSDVRRDFRPVQPDALLDVAGDQRRRPLFVEYDRTRRVDKNYDKFRRYETLLVVWWSAPTSGRPLRSSSSARTPSTGSRLHRTPPTGELTGHLTARSRAEPLRSDYPARDRILFVLESDIRNGDDRRRSALPALPPRHETATTRVRRVTCACRASRTEINTVPLRPVPSEVFRPGGPLRAEHAPRPADARNPRSRLCCTRKGGPPLRAGPPFLDMPDKSGQGRTGGMRSGRRRVGAEAGRRERGTMQRVGRRRGSVK